MKTIQEIKDMLSRSEGEEALTAANEIVNDKATNRQTLAMAYYLRGHAYRHIQELLDFYNKDYYNP